MTNIPTVVNPRAPKRMVGCELLNLAAHNPADLVQLSEQQYQSRIDAAAAYVLASGRRIVMLTGPSAAGKTTSANKLAAAMRSRMAGMITNAWKRGISRWCSTACSSWPKPACAMRRFLTL